jgi:hypothetical protein
MNFDLARLAQRDVTGNTAPGLEQMFHYGGAMRTARA